MKVAIHLMLLGLTPGFAQITGTLVSPANQPLAGCEVKMGANSVLSAANGTFQLVTTSIRPLSTKSSRTALELFDARGARLDALDRAPVPAFFRFASGGTRLSIALAKSAAADSLKIKCPGYVLQSVAVAGPSANLGNITLSVTEPAPGTHIDYNPYANPGAGWYKVVTHSHTKAHEPERQTTPVKIAQAYKDLGIHAVAFTDHDALTKPSTVTGILYIPGEEVTTSDGDMNVFAINKVIPANMNGQKVIDAAIAAGNGFTQVNHPLDSDANDAGRLATYLAGLKNLWGIEIYNGGRMDQDATASWDALISQKKRIWATAGDDAHSILVIDDGENVPETGRKWIVVNSHELTVDGIVASMRAGNFYGSEGPDMRISVSGDVVSVSSATGNKVTWFTTARKQIKQTTLGADPDTYTLTGSETFVRVLVTDGKGKRAFSQPIFTK